MSDTEALVSPRKVTTLTSQLILATLVACLGSLQYGYHIAELNAPEQSMTCQDSFKFNVDCIDLTDQQFGAITAIFSIGGLCGSLVSGKLADKYGRKKIAILANLIMGASSLILFISNNFWSIFFGRVIVGIGCGINIVITPLYINEIAPINLRGALGTMNQLCINIGILLTQSVALKFANVDNWRKIFFVGLILALSNIIGWISVYESPKWLLSKNELHDTYESLSHIRQVPIDQVKLEIETWQNEGSRSNSNASSNDSNGIEPSLWEYLTNLRYMKPRNVILTILTGQQFCGINSIIFYGVKIISKILPEYALILNFTISIINVVVTFIASTVVDYYGRKPLLIISASTMGVMSLFIGISIINDYSILLISAVFTYICSFAIGVGPIPFLIIGELSAKEDKAIAQSFGTVCNWLATFLVGYTFPLINNLIDGYVYFIFAAFAIWFAQYIYYNVPETKNRDNYTEIWSPYQ